MAQALMTAEQLRRLLAEKPPHGASCNRCGWCCRVSLCDLGSHVFQRPKEPGPCPALTTDDDGLHACGLATTPEQFVDVASTPERNALVVAASVLTNSGNGCDMVLTIEARNHAYLRAMDEIDRRNSAVIAAARIVWSNKEQKR